jgi:DNA-3-methyladenine glycosylase II
MMTDTLKFEEFMRNHFMATIPGSFSSDNFKEICDLLAGGDKELRSVTADHGYPPMWHRPNTFETLVHIILEQQVSLASALAALNKLRKKIKRITPARVLKLTDDELRDAYFSRQKMVYVRALANAIVNRTLNLTELAGLPDDEVRNRLTAIKGIGNWTADIYLIFVLQRTDVFPAGDLAAVNALKHLKKLPANITRDELLDVAAGWQPYRTIATMLLWHSYLSLRTKKQKI